MFLELSDRWWAIAIRGVVALLFGILAFVWPGITLLALVMLFAAYAILDGVFSIIAAINLPRTAVSEHGLRWWALLIEVILGIVAGALAIWLPGITALVLLYIIAFWAVITGIFEIITAIRLRKEISGEWLMAISGVASVVFGVLLLLFPGSGALAIIWLIGAYAIIFGVLLLTLAIRLRKYGREAVSMV
jgi:uncharacterized membrane protein HdeD (DUF308 family)